MERERGRMVEGFSIEPLADKIFVCDYGQPDMTTGGILYGDSSSEFYRYRQSEWRHGEVIAIGPGRREGGSRLPVEGIELGDVIMFSRKHGTRLPGELRYQHPKYTDDHPASKGLLIRVLDPDKCNSVCVDFVPWWNVQDSQIDPSGIMTG